MFHHVPHPWNRSTSPSNFPQDIPHETKPKRANLPIPVGEGGGKWKPPDPGRPNMWFFGDGMILFVLSSDSIGASESRVQVCCLLLTGLAGGCNMVQLTGKIRSRWDQSSQELTCVCKEAKTTTQWCRSRKTSEHPWTQRSEQAMTCRGTPQAV